MTNAPSNCGGFPLPLGTTIGLLTTNGKTTVSSVESIAAVTTQSGKKAVAWIVLDETATRWLAISASSPADIKSLVPKPALDFTRHPELKIHFTPLTEKLPGQYRLTACKGVSDQD
jgi:hypothetical protein